MTQDDLPLRYLSPGLEDQDWQSFNDLPLRDVELSIYAGIWTGIASGRLQPGHKLDEAVLCDIYGVSRTVVRRVLYMLEEQGVVTLLPNRGAWVASPTLEEAFEIAEIVETALSHVVTSLAAKAHVIRPDAQERLARHLLAEQAANERGNWQNCRRLRMDFGTLLMFVHGNRSFAATWQRNAMQFCMALSLHQAIWNVVEEARFARGVADSVLAGNGAEAKLHVHSYLGSIVGTFRTKTAAIADLKSALTRRG